MSKKRAGSTAIYVAAILTVVAAAYYYLYDPRTGTSLPMLQCPFHLLTGLSCPACGLQRALHLLLHGQPLAALSYNYLLALAIPLTLLVALCRWKPQAPVIRWFAPKVGHRYTHATLVLLTIAWWIIRNVMGV